MPAQNDLAPAPAPRPPLTAGFLAVIVFKWVKAAGFILFGILALRLARASEMPSAIQIADFFSISRENELVHRVADFIAPVTPREATGFGVASILVAGVFFAEGSLLAYQVWWSTFFTITLTALGIPLELYEIARRPLSLRRYLLLAVNLAILVYLWRKRNEFRPARGGSAT
jgi:hypothetical protein